MTQRYCSGGRNTNELTLDLFQKAKKWNMRLGIQELILVSWAQGQECVYEDLPSAVPYPAVASEPVLQWVKMSTGSSLNSCRMWSAPYLLRVLFTEMSLGSISSIAVTILYTQLEKKYVNIKLCFWYIIKMSFIFLLFRCLIYFILLFQNMINKFIYFTCTGR